MRIVFVFLQIILLLLCKSTAHIGNNCSSNANCLDFEKCENNTCVLCTSQNAVCYDYSWPCCEGTSCQEIPNLNTSMCVPNNNNCKSDVDCVGGLRCIVRLGKCGICNSNGKHCTLPYDSLECCSSYCAIHIDGGICTDPWSMVTKRPHKDKSLSFQSVASTTTPVPATNPKDLTIYNLESIRNVQRHVGTKKCTSALDCELDEKCTTNFDFYFTQNRFFSECLKCLNSSMICYTDSDCCSNACQYYQLGSKKCK